MRRAVGAQVLGKGAETVYRSKDGRKITKEEFERCGLRQAFPLALFMP